MVPADATTLSSQEPNQALMDACPVPSSGAAAIPSIQGLSPNDHPIQFKIQFVNEFVNVKTNLWTRPEQDKVCAATAYIQQVWSSTEFERAVETKSWILGIDWKWLGLKKRYVSGRDLYKSLTSGSSVTLRLSISSDENLVANYALSDARGWTFLQRSYVDESGQFACLKANSVVSCLTDTISHEYTHYGAAVKSTDGTKGAVDNDDYVSYGIGDLTQSLAFPAKPKP
jgi:hypothetical protein